MVNSN